jgi:hypothetical protein
MPDGMMNTVPRRTTERIRELARKVADIASRPDQQEKIDLWTRKNALEHVRPMVLIFPEGSWEEVMADWEWEADDAFTRSLEQDLCVRLYYAEHLRDDSVVEPVVGNPTVVHSTGYGFDEARTEPSQHKGAYRIEPVLIHESDARRIAAPEIRVDWEATRRNASRLEDLLDGTLSVETRLDGDFRSLSLMDTLARWRGIEQLFMDLVERPQWIHDVVSRMLDAKMMELHQLQAQGALTLNNRNTYNGSGGFGWTRELPQKDFDGVHVRPRDLWGYARAQIFCRVSPQMHEEFSLRYERRFLECFGLASYGCCEPLHDRLALLKKIANLRVISISPWADIEKSAESLGDRYVYSWKPNPAVMAASAWNADAVRRDVRSFLERTRGCITQIVMKDVHTSAREPRRLSEWVRIAKEEVAREVQAHGAGP